MTTLLHEQELADLEVAQAVASMQQAESSGGRPSAPVRELEGDDPSMPMYLRDPDFSAPGNVDDNVPNDSSVLSEDNVKLVRRKLHEYCMVKRETPTLEKLHRVLGRDCRFSCSRLTLLKLLRMAGYRVGKRHELIMMPRASPQDPALYNPDSPN